MRAGQGLDIALAPERLDEGSPEERACFGLLTIRADGLALTEGFDAFTKGYRPGPLVSGYHAAEWFAGNWWRLRWEPRSAVPDWWRAHKMNSIGEGYVWPNLTLFSDGMRTALIARPSSRPDAEPFRYAGAPPQVMPSSQFEKAIDTFLLQIAGRLRDAGIADTNLDRLWQDVLTERKTPALAMRRKIEALLGCDPDQADEAAVDRLLMDALALGEAAMSEVAADRPHGGALLTAEALSLAAEQYGVDAGPGDVVRLAPGPRSTFGGPAMQGAAAPKEAFVPGSPYSGEVPAWWLGARAARALREQEKLGKGPIANEMLAKLAGVSSAALSEKTAGPLISFALDEGATKGRVVLRSRWETGRRFELARILGDRILAREKDRLFPATRAYTYRQKMQRSFAAELLSPFESLDDMLSGDYSMESQQDAAAYFQVSELTIRTLLVNHGRLEREDLDEEVNLAIA